ncbi:arsinothricin resistance N-acetyltransferase ArsN1 family A [Pseudomonas sp. RP23018S]|uniref:arsinothricin resistance N-acetyltransferase ArsN1 family A n=1 Tax=Pseudomonas sp. RP23018S TaxID=3096037 RepID=UPI002ACA6D2A|nr:arsinothricin resistance N-acetyltransferase ArsN1 family A [Pseudomonas sp. RP23018S]MDZ5602924.1 arsinothricin resistance N-acetyltransferase ArsN1 family A [Pseudomonas sp. RP23018S]
MRIRPAETNDALAIAAIYNQGIEERSSTFETTPRNPEEMLERIQSVDRYPVLVMLGEHDQVIGWASLSGYRARVCYNGIADFSIYLSREVRGRGLGKHLLQALLKEAQERGFWKVLSRVFTFNRASLALCEACGFRQVGVYEKHACLDGRWIDCVIVERLFPENQATGGAPVCGISAAAGGLSGC